MPKTQKEGLNRPCTNLRDGRHSRVHIFPPIVTPSHMPINNHHRDKDNQNVSTVSTRAHVPRASRQGWKKRRGGRLPWQGRP